MKAGQGICIFMEEEAFLAMKEATGMLWAALHDTILEKNPGDELGARICDVRAADFWCFHD
jgi:hypothetical protein